MSDELAKIQDELAMMRADSALLIHYVRAISETLGLTERLRIAEAEHRNRVSELSGNSLWSMNGAHGDDERPTDPAASGKPVNG